MSQDTTNAKTLPEAACAAYRGNGDVRYHQAVRFAEQIVQRATSRAKVLAAIEGHRFHGWWLRAEKDPAATKEAIVRDAEDGMPGRIPYQTEATQAQRP